MYGITGRGGVVGPSVRMSEKGEGVCEIPPKECEIIFECALTNVTSLDFKKIK